jgi:hypothetical protein
MIPYSTGKLGKKYIADDEKRKINDSWSIN